jgi:hypothetical protein
MQHDELMERALGLLHVMGVQDAVSHLVEAGVDSGEAFLAVQAAAILALDQTHQLAVVEHL